MTITEHLIAMGIGGLVFGTVYCGIFGGLQAMQFAREANRAGQILMEKCETIRLYTWDQIQTPGFIPTNWPAYYDPSRPSGQKGAVYAGTLHFEPCGLPVSYSNELKKVVVTVKWRTGNVARQRTMTTLVGREGIQNYVY